MLKTIVTYVWTIGLGLVASGALQNAVARITPPRPDDDRSLGGIHDRVVRRAGPPTWRIGLAILVIATPPLVVVWT